MRQGDLFPRQVLRTTQVRAGEVRAAQVRIAQRCTAKLRSGQVHASHIRSWRRALTHGFGPVHETLTTEIDRSTRLWVWEEAVVPGLLQTAVYTRHILKRYAGLLAPAVDIDAAVRTRVQRQEWLYRAGRTLHVITWEAALRALICPPSTLAAQLDRLTCLIGMDTVELGVIPFSASLKLPAANGFWIFDDRLVVTEDWHAEVWLDDADSIALYRKAWHTLRESAVYGTDAHNVISTARRALTTT